MLRVVADLGNSRLKWGRVGPGGELETSLALPTDDPSAWSAVWESWNPGSDEASWAIASVNPPLAGRLGEFLDSHGIRERRWYRSAADVPVRHALQHVETAGADRALAVLAALGLHSGRGAGLVVSCGSAVTVERISPDGTWQGGAITPGLGLSARALHLLTAQLPLVTPREGPSPWGSSTIPALEAGLFWGVVGAVRELLTRQSADLSPEPWLVWTGGDAALLAHWVPWSDARVVPDLVLQGLARAAFS